MRVLVDTNVWVSALIRPQSVPHKVVQSPVPYQLLTSEEMLAELDKVLHYPKIQERFELSEERIQEYIQTIQKTCEIFAVDLTLDVVQQDPADNKVLACAKAAKANYIITGDPHLTTLSSFDGIVICTPSQFLNLLKHGQETREQTSTVMSLEEAFSSVLPLKSGQSIEEAICEAKEEKAEKILINQQK
jgi:uncharacterized protein